MREGRGLKLIPKSESIKLLSPPAPSLSSRRGMNSSSSFPHHLLPGRICSSEGRTELRADLRRRGGIGIRVSQEVPNERTLELPFRPLINLLVSFGRAQAQANSTPSTYPNICGLWIVEHVPGPCEDICLSVPQESLPVRYGVEAEVGEIGLRSHGSPYLISAEAERKTPDHIPCMRMQMQAYG